MSDGPVVHLVSGTVSKKRARPTYCSAGGYSMGISIPPAEHDSRLTTDQSKVTCKRCLKLLAARRTKETGLRHDLVREMGELSHLPSISLDECEGKTVKLAVQWNRQTVVIFTDATFACLSYETVKDPEGYDDDDYLEHEITTAPLRYTDAHGLGIITKREYERRRKKIEKLQSAINEASERARYERLKERFEP